MTKPARVVTHEVRGKRVSWVFYDNVTDEASDVCDDWWQCEGRARYGTWLVVIGGPLGAGATNCSWCGRLLAEV
jgi:hypothetical protein